MREFQKSHRIKSIKKDVKTVEIDGVGPVLFERSKRAKHLNISVRPYKGVRVAIPAGLSFKKAEEFVHSRKGWINKHLDRIEAAAADGHGYCMPVTPSESTSDPDTSSTLKTATVLDVMDMTLSLPKREYKQELQAWQAKLNQLQRAALKKKLSTILVFEGPDAAGKGGAIRRVTAALDARHVRVLPIAAPTDEEIAHQFLWRFWRHLPRAGKMTVFDRSWYGRVLVERIEDFASEDEWRRAYSEINEFEEQLTSSGIVLVKFWVHVTKDEQLRRFQEREKIPHKQWKLTEEDWRNREKWEEYEVAVNDFVEHTSTRVAPWNLIEGNDKRHARVKVIKTVCEYMENALKSLESKK